MRENQVEIQLFNHMGKSAKVYKMTMFYGKYEMPCPKKGEYEIRITNRDSKIHSFDMAGFTEFNDNHTIKQNRQKVEINKKLSEIISNEKKVNDHVKFAKEYEYEELTQQYNKMAD